MSRLPSRRPLGGFTGALLAVSLVVACGEGPAPLACLHASECPPGDVCTASGICGSPEGFSACSGARDCKRGDEDAGVDEQGIVVCADEDGDGRGPGCASGADNCLTVQNPDQADEDRDGLGDACDGCPANADLGVNQDEDALDAACDPDDLVPGHELLFFDPFAGSTRSAVWEVEYGSAWSMDEGAMVQGQLSYTSISLPIDAADIVVRLRLSPTLSDSNDSPDNAMVGLRVKDGEQGYLCSARKSEPDTAAVFIMEDLLFPAPAIATVLPGGTLVMGEDYELVAEAKGDRVTCSLGAASVTLIDDRFSSGAVSLATDDMSVRYHSVALYALPR